MNEECYSHYRDNANICRQSCAYCDRRGGEGPTASGGCGAASGRCIRTESELIYRRRDADPVYLVMTADGRLELVMVRSDTGPDPWSPAALLRAAFAERVGTVVAWFTAGSGR